ncbi:MAG TPA: hypothetical protein VH637_01895 [Streptosporangiaceae bacterium]
MSGGRGTAAAGAGLLVPGLARGLGLAALARGAGLAGRACGRSGALPQPAASSDPAQANAASRQ